MGVVRSWLLGVTAAALVVALAETLAPEGSVKKVCRLALKSALSAKAAAGNVLVVDKLEMGEIKTKTFQSFLNTVESKKAVVVTGCPNVVKSARNIPGVVTSPAALINVYDIVNANQVIIDRGALAAIEEVFA